PIRSASSNLHITIHSCLRLLMPHLRIVKTTNRSKSKIIKPQITANARVQSQVPNTMYTANPAEMEASTNVANNTPPSPEYFACSEGNCFNSSWCAPAHHHKNFLSLGFLLSPKVSYVYKPFSWPLFTAIIKIYSNKKIELLNKG